MNFMQNLTDNNRVTLVGEIADKPLFSHELFGEKFYDFKLKCNRSSGNVDIICITVSDRVFDVNQLKEDLIIKIKGQLRTYNVRSNEDGNKLKIAVFVKALKIVNNDSVHRNEIYLDGFICKKPNYRETPLGRVICDLIIAINRLYKKSDYIPCISWGRNAKYCHENINIGDNVRVRGRIQSRIYDKRVSDDNIIQKTAYEVSISKIEINKELNNKK